MPQDDVLPEPSWAKKADQSKSKNKKKSSSKPEDTTGTGHSQGFFGRLRHDVAAAAEGVPGKIATSLVDPTFVVGPLAEWWGEGKSKGGKDQGKGKGPKGPTGPSSATVQSNVEQIGKDINAIYSPYEKEAAGLSGQYEQTLNQLNALPGGNQGIPAGTYTGPGADKVNQTASALGNAIQGETGALMQGAKGIESAAEGIAPAMQTAASDLPYADVIQTLLTGAKNQLLYGTTPSFQVDPKKSHWSPALQDIYSYLQGNKAGNVLGGGGVGSGSVGVNTLPLIGAASQSSPQGNVPPAGNASSGGVTGF